MHLAVLDVVDARWTDQIHEEWTRSVLADRPDLKPEQLARTRSLMNAHVRDALVTGYEPLIPSLSLPDPDNRHVLAAAIHAGATGIVTFNLSDFPAEALAPHGIEAHHPDDFVRTLLDEAPGLVCLAAKRQRESLRKPTRSVEEYLETLERVGLSHSAQKLRALADLL